VFGVLQRLLIGVPLAYAQQELPHCRYAGKQIAHQNRKNAFPINECIKPVLNRQWNGEIFTHEARLLGGDFPR